MSTSTLDDAPATGSRVPDCSFDFEGQSVPAVAGEPVAVALFASDNRVLSRSSKFHRPRTFFCLQGHCGACLMRVDGQPNVKACQAPARAGLVAERQNAFPSGTFDMLAATDFFFPKGMDHHTLLTGPRPLNVLVQKVVRQLGGLGQLPDTAPAPAALPQGRRRHVDVLVVGAGPAGLAAAIAARRARPSAEVVVIDEGDRPGGSLWSWPGGRADAERLGREAAQAGVELWPRSPAVAWYPEDDGGVIAALDGRGGRARPAAGSPPSPWPPLVRLSAARYVYATGSFDQPLWFGNNDRPGILAARAVGLLLERHHVVGGRRIAVLGPADADAPAEVLGYAGRLGEALAAAGAEVTVLNPALDTIEEALGTTWVKGLVVERDGKRRRVRCDLVAVGATPAPASELPRMHGVPVVLDPAAGGFACQVDGHGGGGAPGAGSGATLGATPGATSVAGVYVAGDVRGYRGPLGAEEDGARVGRAVAATL